MHHPRARCRCHHRPAAGADGVLPGSLLRIIRVSPFGETLEVALDQGEAFALSRW